MVQPKALVVEDTPEFAGLFSRLLRDEGFVVATAADGRGAVSAVRAERPELVLLDVSLPGLDGFEVCRQLREFSDAYVVMVTGRDDEVDKVVGLTVGADDYVTKPFSPRELSARIRAMRRRPRVVAQPGVREFERLVVDPLAREVLLDGEHVELTKIEFDLLSGRPRHTFSRQHLLSTVWGGTWFGDDHVIDVHVGNLRRKLGESAGRPRHVRTVRGVGYRFDP